MDSEMWGMPMHTFASNDLLGKPELFIARLRLRPGNEFWQT